MSKTQENVDKRTQIYPFMATTTITARQGRVSEVCEAGSDTPAPVTRPDLTGVCVSSLNNAALANNSL